MKHITKKLSVSLKYRSGFVLPFTLLICAIMLLISVGIAAILMKQIYFSNIGRESQIAYYAADNALACAVLIEETYVSGSSGIFPSDPSILLTAQNVSIMEDKIDAINNLRVAIEPPIIPLANNLNDIKCAQSYMFDTNTAVSDFTADTLFQREIPGSPPTIEEGVTSTFNMKMKVADNDYRCAKVTINKTETYKQIVAQGYSRCDNTNGSIERAVVYSTVQ